MSRTYFMIKQIWDNYYSCCNYCLILLCVEITEYQSKYFLTVLDTMKSKVKCSKCSGLITIWSLLPRWYLECCVSGKWETVFPCIVRRRRAKRYSFKLNPFISALIYWWNSAIGKETHFSILLFMESLQHVDLEESVQAGTIYMALFITYVEL